MNDSTRPASPPGPTGPHRDSAERIRVLRPVVIILIVAIHVPFALYRPDLNAVELTLGAFLSAWISGTFALAALPTLSVISGYLALGSLTRKGYPGFAGGKFRRLAIPMVLWGLPSALWIYYQQAQGLAARPDLALYPFDPEGWFRALTAIGRLPANPPLYFLRELLFSALLIPAWMMIARSRVASAALIGAIGYCSLAGLNFGLFHRIDIYGYFFIGVWIAMHPEIAALEQRLRRYTPVLIAGLLAFAAGLALYSFSSDPRWFHPLTQVVRLFGPLVFWLASASLVESAFRAPLLRLEPASYTIFLGHAPVMVLLMEIWRQGWRIGPYGTTYLAFTLTMIGGSVVILWGLWAAYRRFVDRIRIDLS